MFRALALFLILVLAVGTATHAVQASDMTVKMAAGAVSDGAMPMCDGCGDGEDAGKLVCPLTCVAPAVTILDPDGAVAPGAAAVAHGPASGLATGRTTPVDPSPPRRRVLT